MNSAGTTPPGTSSEEQAARWVERMFAAIAPRYDLINHLLSFNIDRSWRTALIRRLQPVLRRSDAKILDLCCGTGDVLLALAKASASPVIGADFCHPMLVAAREKAARKGCRAHLLEADALRLPLRDAALDAISIAFGFRNLANYSAGLAEFSRVLKPGGVLAILEFSQPQGLVMKTAYGVYSRVIMPAVGSFISGRRDAYAYLPDSIRKFPSPVQLVAMMQSSGFTKVTYELLTGGIAALHIGYRGGFN